MRAYRFYRLGLLPNGTSYIMESKKYIDAMAIIGNEIAKLEEAQMSKVKHGRS